MMGHSDLDMTTRYVHATSGDKCEPPPMPWIVFYAASRLDFNFNSNSIGLT